ncbi:hypothetical protein PRK78_002689 [Emydomyces testavorans]|uniref:Uncharacterized protein n=1 Tax=Emydomyces testavorans TaxID=2070801 RepID=A0AAF0DES7_9EURO|nr:hypothetical protein PRK78_002689 [Emydomyces testavorans]
MLRQTRHLIPLRGTNASTQLRMPRRRLLSATLPARTPNPPSPPSPTTHHHHHPPFSTALFSRLDKLHSKLTTLHLDLHHHHQTLHTQLHTLNTQFPTHLANLETKLDHITTQFGQNPARISSIEAKLDKLATESSASVKILKYYDTLFTRVCYGAIVLERAFRAAVGGVCDFESQIALGEREGGGESAGSGFAGVTRGHIADVFFD